MEVVFAIVGVVIDRSVAPLGRQLGYIFGYKSNVEELKSKIEKLEDERDNLQHLVDASMSNGEEIVDGVKKWLERVHVISGEVKRFQDDECHSSAGCNNWSCPNLSSRRRLSMKAKKMVRAIAEIQGEGKFKRVSYRVVAPWIDGISTAGYMAFESRTLVLNEVVEALRDPTVNMVGVYGLAGVGKTTLVKEVARKSQEDKFFDRVVMVVVTQKVETDKIQKEIAEMLGLKFDEESELIRAGRLRDRFKQEKNILVILDDLWAWLDLGKIGIPFGNDHKGCKLLLTSRNQEVLSSQMDTQKSFFLGVLLKEEAWKLFKEMAGLDDSNSNTELLSTAAEVSEECAGLPVAIVTVARALKKKSLFEWRDALRQLKSPTSRNITGMQDVVDSSIKLSYDYLESDELKSTFFLCAFMDHDAFTMDLLKYCLGLGLFKGIYAIAEARDRLHTLVSKLKASCLLLDSHIHDNDGDRFNMHDVVSDVAISIASQNQHAFTVRYDKLPEWPDTKQLENCTTMTLDYSDISKLPQVLDCPRLQFFRIFSKDPSLQIADDFFKRLGELKVLDLTEIHFSSLPSSMTALRNLSTLCLDCCVLEDIVIVGELKNLKILSFLRSDIKQLPCEIKNLTQLKLLDLSNCSKLEVIPPNIISSLTNLEELYMENSFVRWQGEKSNKESSNASLAELKNLPHLTTLEICVRDASIFPQYSFFEKLERYRILVGDMWSWSGKYKHLRTLKLKLSRSFHLEQGVKMLLKSVEDLYLDELAGVADVVYQLNGEGFPNLKHLHIQNSSELRYITNSLERFDLVRVFISLESLVLQKLTKLEKICHGQISVPSFSELKVIKVKGCDCLKNVFSLSMAGGLSKLVELEVSECNLMEEIIFLQSEETNTDCINIEFGNLHSLTLQNLPLLSDFLSKKKTSSVTQGGEKELTNDVASESAVCQILFCEKVAFPNLEMLKLSSINFKKIWHDQPSASSWIMNLTNLIVEGCGSLKHLFTYSVARNLVNLKHLEISKCRMMEEILPTEEIMSSSVIATLPRFSEEFLLPNLETMIISHMDNLKTLWSDQLGPDSFSKLKTVDIKHCEKLMTICESYMLMKFQNLETLSVADCSSLSKIFGLNAKELHGNIDMRLKKVTLLRLSQLKHIWGGDLQGIVSFQSLQLIHVDNCQKLKSIFPASLAKGLVQLQQIYIKDCDIEEIVANEENGEAVASYVFPHITSVKLFYLPDLKSFYKGRHVLECPLLQELEVIGCDKLEPLGTERKNFRESHQFGQRHVVVPQPLFSIEKVIPNLERMTLNSKEVTRIWNGQFPTNLFCKLKFLRLYHFYDERISFPYWLLQRIPTLEELFVEYSSFKEILLSDMPTPEERQIGPVMNLKKLWLWGLGKLENISKEGSQVDTVLENLKHLCIVECSNFLKLAPSKVSFNHLTYLEVKKCENLAKLVTSSTARSLAQLKTMKIKDCKMIEEIIATDTLEEEEIEFCQLEILELECLPNLMNFCSNNCILKFPYLEGLSVKECLRMKIFSLGIVSTPKLQKVQVEGTEDEWYWEGNLNETIEKLFKDKVALHSIEHLELCEFPELYEIWHQQFPDRCFRKLKSLVVENCHSLSNVISLKLLRLLNQLEELKVENCDGIEAIFDLEGINEDEESKMEATSLQNLSLNNLPRLQHVWKKDPQDFISFQNLQVLQVLNCESLNYLFPLSVAKALNKLERIKVDNCAMLETVAKEEGVATTISFLFPRVTYVGLGSLPKFNNFYPGPHTIEWPMLKDIEVLSCDQMALFTTDSVNSGEAHSESLPVGIEQPIFSAEKVIPNLEHLSLDSKNVMRIQQGHIPVELFHSLKLLRLHCFDDEHATFPYWLLEAIPALEQLAVRESSFKKIFRSRRLGMLDTQTTTSLQIKQLLLWALPNLENICQEGFQLDPTLEFLELLKVYECSSFMNLVPSVVSFKHLTYLDVWNCDALVYLVASSTAKSFVQLTELRIRECTMIQEIVVKEGDEDSEIVFSSLKFLDLLCLPKLFSFCSSNHVFQFPLLESVIVKQCPRMKVFSCGVSSTPKLQKVHIDENTNEFYWEGYLNSTIEKLFKDMVGFCGLENLDLSVFPELEYIWQNPHQLSSFCNLKSIVMEKCEVSSTVISSNLLLLLNNLEELEVKNCDSVEVVFDVEEMRGQVTERILAASRLKKLTLSYLPNLKHVWNKDPKEMLSFQNLKNVKIFQCQSLKNLFPLTVAKGLVRLKELDIESSGIEEIVAMEERLVELEIDNFGVENRELQEAVSEAAVNFVFPSVDNLRLWELRKLRSFYPGKYTLDWPMLKFLDMYICSEVCVFASELLTFQDTHQEDGFDTSNQQALFLVEKVIPNLEELSLNCQDAVINWPAQFPAYLFSRLRLLRIQFFDDDQASFPYWFLQKIPHLQSLVVKFSSFKELFPDESIAVLERQTGTLVQVQLKSLWLWALRELDNMCKEGSQLDPLLEKLENLNVWECSNLTRLVPFSVFFSYLRHLEVKQCDGLLDLVVSSTAKSLVQLETLTISNCILIEEIIADEGLEADEIELGQLKVLELLDLPNLTSFCSMDCAFRFPNLEIVSVKGCPSMQTFSNGISNTPKLENIQVENTEGEWCWEGSLNATIEKQYNDRLQTAAEAMLQDPYYSLFVAMLQMQSDPEYLQPTGNVTNSSSDVADLDSSSSSASHYDENQAGTN